MLLDGIQVMSKINEKLNTKIIGTLFRRANENGIKYCVLRNYTELPSSTLGGDIDLLIDYACLNQWELLLEDICRFFKLESGIIQSHYHGVRYCIYSEEENFFLKLDVHFGEFWRGVEYLSGKELLRRSVLSGEIYRISDVDEAVLSLLDPLITGGQVRERYFELIVREAEINLANFAEVLSKIIGSSLSMKIGSLASEGDFKVINKLVTKVRYALWFRMFFKSKIKSCFSIVSYIKYEIRRRVYPLGYIIILDGTDNEIEEFSNMIVKSAKVLLPGLGVHSELLKANQELRSVDFRLINKVVQSYNIVICSIKTVALFEEKLRFRSNINLDVIKIGGNEVSQVSPINDNYAEVIASIFRKILKVYSNQ